MFILFRLVMLIMLVQVLIHTSKPLFCAGLYTLISFLIAWISTQVFWVAALIALGTFMLSWVYFWLLERFDESLFFWPIMLAGMGLMIISPL